MPRRAPSRLRESRTAGREPSRDRCAVRPRGACSPRRARGIRHSRLRSSRAESVVAGTSFVLRRRKDRAARRSKCLPRKPAAATRSRRHLVPHQPPGPDRGRGRAPRRARWRRHPRAGDRQATADRRQSGPLVRHAQRMRGLPHCPDAASRPASAATAFQDAQRRWPRSERSSGARCRRPRKSARTR